MTGGPVKSSGISPRRALLEEILERRSRAVATLPILEDEPGPGSPLWMAGICKLAFNWRHGQRETALDIAVVALAWLEAIDRG